MEGCVMKKLFLFMFITPINTLLYGNDQQKPADDHELNDDYEASDTVHLLQTAAPKSSDHDSSDSECDYDTDDSEDSYDNFAGTNAYAQPSILGQVLENPETGELIIMPSIVPHATLETILEVEEEPESPVS